LKTPSWSVVYDFSVDVFCKLGNSNNSSPFRLRFSPPSVNEAIDRVEYNDWIIRVMTKQEIIIGKTLKQILIISIQGGMESWSGVLKTPSWSVVYDFSVDVFCKLGIDQ
jgi:hypothetical protein